MNLNFIMKEEVIAFLLKIPATNEGKYLSYLIKDINA